MARVQQSYMMPGQLPGQPMAPPGVFPEEEQEAPPSQTERAIAQAQPGIPPEQARMQAQQVISQYGGDDEAAARSVIETALPQLVGYQPADRQQRVADGQAGVAGMNALASTQDFLNRVNSYGAAGDRNIQRPNPLRQQAQAFEGQLRGDFDAERRMAETGQRLDMQVQDRQRDQANQDRSFGLQQERFDLERRQTEPKIAGLERAEGRAQQLQQVDSPETAMLREALSTAFPDMAEGMAELDGEALKDLEQSIRAGQNRLDALARHQEAMAVRREAIAAKRRKGGGSGGGKGPSAQSELVSIIADQITENDPELTPAQVQIRAEIAATDPVVARSYLRANPEKAKRFESMIQKTDKDLTSMNNALGALNALEKELGFKLRDIQFAEDGTPTVGGKEVELPGFYSPFNRMGREMRVSNKASAIGTALQGYQSIILKERSGAAVTEPEQQRMEAEMSFGPTATSARILRALARHDDVFRTSARTRLASLPPYVREEYLRRQKDGRGIMQDIDTPGAGARAPGAQPQAQGPKGPPPPGPAMVNLRKKDTGEIVEMVPIDVAREIVQDDPDLEIF